MRKFFIVVIFFCSTNYCLSQQYYPFPQSNAKWSEIDRFEYGGIGGQFNIISNGLFYALVNDTIINSLHYSLLGYQSTFHSQESNSGLIAAYNVPIHPPGQVFGAIREDTFKRIWFMNLDSGFMNLPADTEILLYDFNLQIGDSITWATVDTKVVYSISFTSLNDGSFRTTYLLSSMGETETWIEGIGSSLGLFGAYGYPPFAPNPHIHLLSCLSVNNINLYNYSQYPNEYECDSTFLHFGLAVPSVNYDKGLLVYFSSTENKLHFSFKDDKYLDANFILYNEIGQEIFKTKITSYNFEIDFSNNPVSGIYFYQIDDYESSKFVSGKFLIE